MKLANYLTKKGIRNAFLTTDILPELKKDLAGTDIILVKKTTINSFKLGEGFMLRRGVGMLIKDFDIINVHNYPAELAIFACFKPAVWMCNEPPPISIGLDSRTPLIKKIIIKMILSLDRFVVRRYVKNAVVADELSAQRFESIYGLKPDIINYGIDYEFFSNLNEDKTFKKSDTSGSFTVLQVGMLTPLKNQIESIRTIEKLTGDIPNIKLILAGWGKNAYSDMVEEYIKEKKLGDRVLITGHLSRESIRDLYHACCLLLHPIEPQGGWLSPFEALCARKPIVVSPGMTASGIIKREKIGVVTKDYAGAILDIYNNPDTYRQVAMRGQEWVRDNLNWDRFCEKMLNLFFRVSKKEET
ncbi:MAG: glycosyltransferase family 4 protein [Deltaproteobacteria bacterium]|nr:glycosyltransferase family 4 protein [Deltaproteobacteria bacterium]